MVRRRPISIPSLSKLSLSKSKEKRLFSGLFSADGLWMQRSPGSDHKLSLIHISFMRQLWFQTWPASPAFPHPSSPVCFEIHTDRARMTMCWQERLTRPAAFFWIREWAWRRWHTGWTLWMNIISQMFSAKGWECRREDTGRRAGADRYWRKTRRGNENSENGKHDHGRRCP